MIVVGSSIVRSCDKHELAPIIFFFNKSCCQNSDIVSFTKARQHGTNGSNTNSKRLNQCDALHALQKNTRYNLSPVTCFRSQHVVQTE